MLAADIGGQQAEKGDAIMIARIIYAIIFFNIGFASHILWERLFGGDDDE